MDESTAEFIDGLSFREYAGMFFKIEDQDTNLVDFVLNEAQQIVYNEMKRQMDNGRPVRVLILKGRQQGMSTFSQGWIAWKMLVNPRTKVLTVAHKLTACHELFEKLKVILHELPEEIKPQLDGYKRGRRASFAEPMASSYRSDSAEKPDDVGRAGTFQHLHLTEIPQWANPDSSMQAVLACVPDSPDTTIIVESTAKGKGNWFYEAWLDAMQKVRNGEEPEFYPVFVPWYKTARYSRYRREGEPELSHAELEFKKKFKLSDEQCYWYRDQRVRYDQRVTEEFPSTWEEAFLSSGSPFFRQDALSFYKEQRRRPYRRGKFKTSGRKGRVKVSFEEQNFGPTRIYEEPEKNSRYVLGVDFASGRAKDHSAIVVLEVDKKKIVATHQSKLLPDEVLHEARFLGTIYNQALIVPERTGIGQPLVDRLLNELRYPFVFREKQTTTVKRAMSNRYGWSTTAASRPAMLEDLAFLVHNREIEIPCSKIFEEMETFVYTDEEGKRAEADGNANDDLIFAAAMAVQGLNQAPMPSTDLTLEAKGGSPRISSRIGY